MRHARGVRRRFTRFLAACLVLCLVFLLEARIEAFVPQLKEMAEIQLSRTLAGRVRLSIGSIDGGILNPLVLNDIKIRDRKGGLVFSSLEINSVKTNYRLWDVLFRREADSVMSNILARDSSMYVSFVTKNGTARGFLRLDGGLEDSRIKGYLLLSDSGQRIDFTGRVTGDRFEAAFRIGDGAISASGSIDPADRLAVDLKITHVKSGPYDIACDVRLTNAAVQDGSGRSAGEIEIKNFILNYKPFLDARGSYVLSPSELGITQLSFGSSFMVTGKVSLRGQHNLDLVITADNVNLNWLLSSLGVTDLGEILTGTMNAKFELKGPASDIRSKTTLDIRNGTISVKDFERLGAVLKGEGPVLKIEESRVTRQSGHFALGGEIDLKRIGKSTLFNSVKVIGDEKAIEWDGWETVHLRDAKELRMKKRLSDEINIDIKKFVSDESIDESVPYDDKIQLEYKLNPTGSMKMSVGQNQDFLGFEHKDKF